MKLFILASFIGLTANMSLPAPEHAPEKSPNTPNATFKIDTTVYAFYDQVIKLHNGTIKKDGVLVEKALVFPSEGIPLGKTDAALNMGDGIVYLFDGIMAHAFSLPKQPDAPFAYDVTKSNTIQRLFQLPSSWSRIDAAIRKDANTLLFFNDYELVVYDLHLKRARPPIKIMESTYSGLIRGKTVQAAFRNNSNQMVYLLR